MSKKQSNQAAEEAAPGSKLHIIFQEADKEVLAKAIELDETLAGDIWMVRDDFATGPLGEIYETEGYQQRRDWCKELLDASPYNTEELMTLVDDRLMVHNLKKRLEENPEEEVWLWMGQNQHDVCGYYWLISQLKDFQGRVVVLYMNNLPFINEKGQIFYPANLHEIQPKEFIKAKKLNRKVTQSEFELDPDEWRKLCTENAMVRILEGGKKIVSKEEDFYDKQILQYLGNEPQKGHRAIQNILSKMKVKTGDVFLLWRMRKMAEQGLIEISGDTSKSWKDFEVKLKSAPAENKEAVVDTNDQNNTSI